MPESDCLKTAQYWFCEVNAIVRHTQEEAVKGGVQLPSDFACGVAWLKAEAAIDQAVANNHLGDTWVACHDYVSRAMRYCQACLRKQTRRTV